MKMAVLTFLLFVFTVGPCLAQDAPQMRTYMGSTKPKETFAKTPDKRQPNVEIWLPPEFQSTEQKWPLLVFSHGFGGCAKQSEFLTSWLADQGYIVIAPDHADARCNKESGRGFVQSRRGARDWPERPFRSPEIWSDKTEADRRDDILFAVASMLDDRQYKNYIDTDKIGLIGHSLGGYTALGLAGAWPSWKDKRFKAVLALSPYVAPYMLERRLAKVNVPVMYQGGTLDNQITPLLMRKGGAYDMTKAPKYLIEYNGAGHLAWTENERDYQAIIRKTALEFLDTYVKGRTTKILPDGAGKNKVRRYWSDDGVLPEKR